MKTAASMHLHHNTLRYRLGRIETALGQSLRSPATVASLHLALVAVSATRRQSRRPHRPLTPRDRAGQGDLNRDAAENPTSHEDFINPDPPMDGQLASVGPPWSYLPTAEGMPGNQRHGVALCNQRRHRR